VVTWACHDCSNLVTSFNYFTHTKSTRLEWWGHKRQFVYTVEVMRYSGLYMRDLAGHMGGLWAALSEAVIKTSKCLTFWRTANASGRCRPDVGSTHATVHLCWRRVDKIINSGRFWPPSVPGWYTGGRLSVPDPALHRPDTYAGRPARRVTRSNLDVYGAVTSQSPILPYKCMASSTDAQLFTFSAYIRRIRTYSGVLWIQIDV